MGGDADALEVEVEHRAAFGRVEKWYGVIGDRDRLLLLAISLFAKYS
jgi:hypothetical protein